MGVKNTPVIIVQKNRKSIHLPYCRICGKPMIGHGFHHDGKFGTKDDVPAGKKEVYRRPPEKLNVGGFILRVPNRFD